MSVKNKKFNVSICLEIKEIKDGEACPFFDDTLQYHDIGYEGVVGIEQVLLGAVSQLAAAGVQTAVDAGLGEKLSIVLGKKVKGPG